VRKTLHPLTAQKSFRALLDGMSRPGEIFALPPTGFDMGDFDGPAAVLLTLLDHEVSFAVAGGDRGVDLTARILSLTRSTPAEVEKADYIFVDGPRSDGACLSARRGREAFPEEGATLIYALGPGDETASSAAIRLSGPGIPPDTVRRPALDGIDADEMSLLAEVNVDYPLGVDAVFVSPEREVMCLPRTTRVKVE
jgi:alpha-D-ribose 1-methylphosphonate 5-triphosphate synthase subunit PhnH